MTEGFTDFEAGAGDGTRTRDNLLGRQELYHLSYSRISEAIVAKGLALVKVARSNDGRSRPDLGRRG